MHESSEYTRARNPIEKNVKSNAISKTKHLQVVAGGVALMNTPLPPR